jgi:hypothetical protein
MWQNTPFVVIELSMKYSCIHIGIGTRLSDGARQLSNQPQEAGGKKWKNVLYKELACSSKALHSVREQMNGQPVN